MSDGFVATGHPVDVASGVVFTAAHDFCLKGALELLWSRQYATSSTIDGALGRGWAAPVLMRLERLPDGYELLDEAGGRVLFPCEGELAEGVVIGDYAANMELQRNGELFTILHWHPGDEIIERFGFEAADGAMPLAFLENLAGHRWTVHCDAQRRPVRITQEIEQRTLDIAYDAADLIVRVSLRLDDGGTRRLVDYAYDDDRHLISATDALGHVVSYAYDVQHRMTHETNAHGSTFSFVYDDRGRCTFTTGDGGYLERRLQFFDHPRMTRVTDSQGHVTEYHANAIGQIIQEVTPSGNITTSEYDALGRYVKITYADGGIESFGWDARGNRCLLVDEEGGTVRLVFNHLHLPVELVDAEGAKRRFAYDPRGCLIAEEDPLGRRTHWLRDGRGFATETHLPGGRVLRHSHGPRMRWTESRDQLSLLERIEYDEFGNETALYDAQGLVRRFEWDALDRIVAMHEADGSSVRYVWNGLHEVVDKIGPAGERQHWSYDGFGQTIAHTGPDGHVMRFAYDREGRLFALRNRAGEHMRWTYDADANLIEEQFFDGRIQRMEYDTTGECVRLIRSDGRSVDRKHDKCGRLTMRKSSDGLHEEFAYNRRGQVIAARNADAVLEFEWDAVGRLRAEVQNGLRIELGYGEDGALASRQVPAHPALALQFTNDLRGRPTVLADVDGPCQTFTWDPLDRLTGREAANGMVRETTAYDAQRRPIDKTVHATSATLARSYAYDAKGNVAAMREQGDVLRYDYDAENRLTAVQHPRRHDERYRYDPVGTVLETHHGPRVTAIGGRTLDDGARQFAYAGDGSAEAITEGGAMHRLAHDVDGNLTHLAFADGREARYRFDALGRRIAKTVDGVETRFLWCGSDLLAELQDDEVRTHELFLHKELLAQWRGGERLFPVTEAQTGAVREMLGPRGDLRWACELDAYGTLLAERGEMAVPFRFRGQYHDRESGLHYNFYRSYDPRLAGYLAPDPIGIEGGSNLYLYPRDPITCDDPFGLRCGGDPNSTHCKGKKGESRMDKHYKDRGYDKISLPGRRRGIDGVYYKKGGKPPYIIVEAKFGSSQLKRTGDDNMQLSDPWINSGIGGGKPDRLTAAVGPTAAARIREQGANKVGKEVFRAPAGAPGYSENAGKYRPHGQNPDVTIQ